ncbi:FAD-dependent oxidoreductase [Mucilaginibacter pallidiroseus]|uniref:FAD-dependent oxidoreductase n=1 Tax=Mucilaginibacter pallidiroseus TaxID=2599295 RepID=A0A563UIT8_9SPHI|nr:FAD-dependent oxidoreductase [Mucilaginibacter pallidiroseus]TWR31213.1 FAD-dependent oxidoreductase [Mucilaginibacter pallidiroseus]
MNKANQRDGAQLAPWKTIVNDEPFVSVTSAPKQTDVIIIGAGITGVTAALRLIKAGKNVLLIDAHNPGFGTTGGTSAHINTFIDTTYKEAEDAFGLDGAKLLADAVNEGFAEIKANIAEYNIECDYAELPGYIYAEDDDQVKELDNVYNGTSRVGVSIREVESVPVNVPYKQALILDGQAQFHPLKYLNGLLRAFNDAGGFVLENTLIDDISKEGVLHKCIAGDKYFYAKDVFYATHIPPKITSFSFRCAPYRSYVVAVELTNAQYPDALIYDLQEPYHYFRTHVIDGQPLLLVGGNDHKTGHDDPDQAFADLEFYVRKYYEVASVKYKWSSQYYIPADGLPYIGQMPETAARVWCATGYNGNGMMLGSISAKIVSDLILGIENRYEKLFSPSRIKPIAGFGEFVKENADVAYHFVADRFKAEDIDSFKEIEAGSGKIVELDGEKIAAYKDEAGLIHALSPVCTHAGCFVNWNNKEKSWDCPCHGARYDIDGNVLTGPADKGLEKFTTN